jgi:hypothetical protein
MWGGSAHKQERRRQEGQRRTETGGARKDGGVGTCGRRDRVTAEGRAGVMTKGTAGEVMATGTAGEVMAEGTAGEVTVGKG